MNRGIFHSEGTWWHILTVGAFLYKAKNRSPWKHYASHSLSGNTRDSEPLVKMFKEHVCVRARVCVVQGQTGISDSMQHVRS